MNELAYKIAKQMNPDEAQTRTAEIGRLAENMLLADMANSKGGVDIDQAFSYAEQFIDYRDKWRKCFAVLRKEPTQ